MPTCTDAWRFARKLLPFLLTASFYNGRPAWTLRPQSEESSLESRQSDVYETEVKGGGHLVLRRSVTETNSTSDHEAAAGGIQSPRSPGGIDGGNSSAGNGGAGAVAAGGSDLGSSPTGNEAPVAVTPAAAGGSDVSSPGDLSGQASRDSGGSGVENSSPGDEGGLSGQERSPSPCCQPEAKNALRSRLSTGMTKWLREHWMRPLPNEASEELTLRKEVTDSQTVIVKFAEARKEDSAWKTGDEALIVGLYDNEYPEGEDEDEEQNIEEFKSRLPGIAEQLDVIARSYEMEDDRTRKKELVRVGHSKIQLHRAYIILLNCPRRWIITNEEIGFQVQSKQVVDKNAMSVTAFLRPYKPNEIFKLWRVPDREDLQGRFVRIEKTPLDIENDVPKISQGGDNQYVTMEVGDDYKQFSIPMWQIMPIGPTDENNPELVDLRRQQPLSGDTDLKPPPITKDFPPKSAPKERFSPEDLEKLKAEVAALAEAAKKSADSAAKNGTAIDSLSTEASKIATQVTQDEAAASLANAQAAEAVRDLPQKLNVDKYPPDSAKAAKDAITNAEPHAEGACKDQVHAASVAHEAVVQAVKAAHEAEANAKSKAEEVATAAGQISAAQRDLETAMAELTSYKNDADTANRSAASHADKAAAEALAAKSATKPSEIFQPKVVAQEAANVAGGQATTCEAAYANATKSMSKATDAQKKVTEYQTALKAAAEAAGKATDKAKEEAEQANNQLEAARTAAKDAGTCKDAQEAKKLQDLAQTAEKEAQKDLGDIENLEADTINLAQEVAEAVAAARQNHSLWLNLQKLCQERTAANQLLSDAKAAATNAGLGPDLCPDLVGQSKLAAAAVETAVNDASNACSEVEGHVREAAEIVTAIEEAQGEVTNANGKAMNNKNDADARNKEGTTAIGIAKEYAERATKDPSLAATLEPQVELALQWATANNTEAHKSAKDATQDFGVANKAAEKVKRLSDQIAGIAEEVKPLEKKVAVADETAATKKAEAVSASDKALVCKAKKVTEEAATKASDSANNADNSASKLAEKLKELMDSANTALRKAKADKEAAAGNLTDATKCVNECEEHSRKAQEKLKELQKPAMDAVAKAIDCCDHEKATLQAQVKQLQEAARAAARTCAEVDTLENKAKQACDPKLTEELEKLEDLVVKIQNDNNLGQGYATEAGAKAATAESMKDQFKELERLLEEKDASPQAERAQGLQKEAEKAATEAERLRKEVEKLFTESDKINVASQAANVTNLQAEVKAAADEATEALAALKKPPSIDSLAENVKEATNALLAAKIAYDQANRKKVPGFPDSSPLYLDDIQNSVIEVRDYAGAWVPLSDSSVKGAAVDGGGVRIFLDFPGILDIRKTQIHFEHCEGDLCRKEAEHRYKIIIERDQGKPCRDRPWKLYKWKGFFGLTAAELQQAAIDVIFQESTISRHLDTPKDERRIDGSQVMFTPKFESMDQHKLEEIQFTVGEDSVATIFGKGTRSPGATFVLDVSMKDLGSNPWPFETEEIDTSMYEIRLTMPADYWCVDWLNFDNLLNAQVRVLGHRDSANSVSKDRPHFLLGQDGSRSKIEQEFDKNTCKLAIKITCNWPGNPRPRDGWVLKFPIDNPKELAITGTSGRELQGFKEPTAACTSPIAKLVYHPKAMREGPAGQGFVKDCASNQCGDMFLPGWWYGPVIDDLMDAKQIEVEGDKPEETGVIEKSDSWKSGTDGGCTYFQCTLKWNGMKNPTLAGENAQIAKFPIRPQDFIRDNDCPDASGEEYKIKGTQEHPEYMLIVKPAQWYAEGMEDKFPSVKIKLPDEFWSEGSGGGKPSGGTCDPNDYTNDEVQYVTQNYVKQESQRNMQKIVNPRQWCFEFPDGTMMPMSCKQSQFYPNDPEAGRTAIECHYFILDNDGCNPEEDNTQRRGLLFTYALDSQSQRAAITGTGLLDQAGLGYRLTVRSKKKKSGDVDDGPPGGFDVIIKPTEDNTKWNEPEFSRKITRQKCPEVAKRASGGGGGRKRRESKEEEASKRCDSVTDVKQNTFIPASNVFAISTWCFRFRDGQKMKTSIIKCSGGGPTVRVLDVSCSKFSLETGESPVGGTGKDLKFKLPNENPWKPVCQDGYSLDLKNQGSAYVVLVEEMTCPQARVQDPRPGAQLWEYLKEVTRGGGMKFYSWKNGQSVNDAYGRLDCSHTEPADPAKLALTFKPLNPTLKTAKFVRADQTDLSITMELGNSNMHYIMKVKQDQQWDTSSAKFITWPRQEWEKNERGWRKFVPNSQLDFMTKAYVTVCGVSAGKKALVCLSHDNCCINQRGGFLNACAGR